MTPNPDPAALASENAALRDENARLRAALEQGQRCSCPVGFGQVASPHCIVHGPTARHTITGPDRVLGCASAFTNLEGPDAE